MEELARLFQDTDLEQYESHIRRLRYDDRDCIMYENMLEFLWPFVVGSKAIDDRSLIFEEYSRWNLQMIDKVYYHDHDVPYANVRRVYQSILELLRDDPGAGMEQIHRIGIEAFSYDGKAPKIRMDAGGRVYRPMSKLFVIYNFAKYYMAHHMEEELIALKDEFSFAFCRFGDGKHQSHDQYLTEQMDIFHDRLIYPVEETIYKIPWGPRDFYLYYDENSYVLITE